MKFTYTAQDSDGKVLKEQAEYSNEEDFMADMAARNLTLINYKSSASGLMSTEIKALERNPSPDDLATFAEQMSVMLSAGITVPRALEQVAADTPNAKLKRALSDIRDATVRGDPFSEAMAGTGLFDDLTVSLIVAGERTSKTKEMLMQLSIMKRKEAGLNAKIRSAMIYPMVMLSMAIILTYAMLTQMVPKFATMVADSGGQMPALTAAVMAVSGVLINNQLYILITVPVAIYLFNSWKKTAAGSAWIDRTLLRVPVIGPLLKSNIVARTSRALGMLIDAGVPMVKALEITGGVSANNEYRSAFYTIRDEAASGESVAAMMRQYPQLFSGMFAAMMQIGEDSGKTVQTMTQTAEQSERIAERRADTLTKTIEPVMLIFVGALIGTIVIAMFLPLFAIMNSISGM